jgi:purine nucleosidase
LLAALGRPDIPVARGAAVPLGPAPLEAHSTEVHGGDGLGHAGPPPAPFGPVDEDAATLLRRLVDERPGEVVVVAVGPLTNVATAIRADPTWPRQARRLVVMGGAVDRPGNVSPMAEANIAHDPEAAAIVVGAEWRTPPLLVGLDVTYQATITNSELDLVAERRTPAAALLAGPIATYQGSMFTAGATPVHDLIAVLAVAHPEIVHVEDLPLAVDTTGGPAWGATIADRRVPYLRRAGKPVEPPPGFFPWQVALGADVDRVRAIVRSLFGG